MKATKIETSWFKLLGTSESRVSSSFELNLIGNLICGYADECFFEFICWFEQKFHLEIESGMEESLTIRLLTHKAFVIFKKCDCIVQCSQILFWLSRFIGETIKLFRIMKYFSSFKNHLSIFWSARSFVIPKIRHKPDYCLLLFSSRYFKSICRH